MATRPSIPGLRGWQRMKPGRGYRDVWVHPVGDGEFVIQAEPQKASSGPIEAYDLVFRMHDRPKRITRCAVKGDCVKAAKRWCRQNPQGVYATVDVEGPTRGGGRSRYARVTVRGPTRGNPLTPLEDEALSREAEENLAESRRRRGEHSAEYLRGRAHGISSVVDEYGHREHRSSRDSRPRTRRNPPPKSYQVRMRALAGTLKGGHRDTISARFPTRRAAEAHAEKVANFYEVTGVPVEYEIVPSARTPHPASRRNPLTETEAESLLRSANVYDTHANRDDVADRGYLHGKADGLRDAAYRNTETSTWMRASSRQRPVKRSRPNPARKSRAAKKKTAKRSKRVAKATEWEVWRGGKRVDSVLFGRAMTLAQVKKRFPPTKGVTYRPVKKNPQKKTVKKTVRKKTARRPARRMASPSPVSGALSKWKATAVGKTGKKRYTTRYQGVTFCIEPRWKAGARKLDANFLGYVVCEKAGGEVRDWKRFANPIMAAQAVSKAAAKAAPKPKKKAAKKAAKRLKRTTKKKAKRPAGARKYKAKRAAKRTTKKKAKRAKRTRKNPALVIYNPGDDPIAEAADALTPKKRAAFRRLVSRCSPREKADLRQALERYYEFHGAWPDSITSAKGKVATKGTRKRFLVGLGKADHIGYHTNKGYRDSNKDGDPFRHYFEHGQELVTDPAGTGLAVVGAGTEVSDWIHG